MSTIDTLLVRLVNVRRCGRGWIALCPAHKDRSASLSVTEADGRKLLVHCFAGCSAADIVAAVGLTLGDLFPERIADQSPLTRAQRREAARQSGLTAALGELSRESTIVEIAAESIRRGSKLEPEDVERVHVAAQRIQDARKVLSL